MGWGQVGVQGGVRVGCGWVRRVAPVALVHRHRQDLALVKGVKLAPEVGNVAEQDDIRVEDKNALRLGHEFGGEKLEEEVAIATQIAPRMDCTEEGGGPRRQS